MTRKSGRCITLSGPSGVGKTPLMKCLKRFFPVIMHSYQKIVLYTSRTPRPGEEDGKDYHFRQSTTIESFREKKEYHVFDVRGDAQAVSWDDLHAILNSGNAFFEGNPFVAQELLQHLRLNSFRSMSMFLSPLNGEEMEFIHHTEKCDPRAIVTDIMRRKLMRRTRRQNEILSLPALNDIERRAGSAYAEMKKAHCFDHVIVNHDGEDSDNWSQFYYPLGDARKAFHAVVSLLQGKSADSEHWDNKPWNE